MGFEDVTMQIKNYVESYNMVGCGSEIFVA
jgi:hypothetical protein